MMYKMINKITNNMFDYFTMQLITYIELAITFLLVF